MPSKALSKPPARKRPRGSRLLEKADRLGLGAGFERGLIGAYSKPHKVGNRIKAK